VIKTLLMLELRRDKPQVVRMTFVTLAICGMFFMAGKRDASSQLAILLGSGLGIVLLVPMGIVRDKMEGTLEFICGLPVEPREIAASRFIAGALVAIPWAAAVGALTFTMRSNGAMNAADAAVLTWLLMCLIGGCITAAVALFDFATLLGMPLVALVAAWILLPRIVGALFPGVTERTVVDFLNRPTTPLILAGALMITLCATGSIAFAAAVRGFARYRHDPAVH
jgi:hypothetical protein